MGFSCCFGSADSDAVAARPIIPPKKNPVVQRTWQVDESWATRLASANGKDPPAETIQQRVRTYIDSLYPQCALVGSIEDMGESRARLRNGDCSPHTYHHILVLDDDFTGVVYSSVMILNLPADADLTPGKWLEAPEMEEVKFHLLRIFDDPRFSEHNAKHAIARIFIGSDAVFCQIRPDNVESTLTVLNKEPSRQFKESNEEMARALRKAKDIPQGIYRAFAFELAMQRLYEAFPGCTVWDEGPLNFNVGGKPFTDPTRLLIARRFGARPENHFQPEEEVEATVYRVRTIFNEDKAAAPLKLLQGRHPENAPGGIVAITVLVATPLTETWPKCGAYAKAAGMKAAKAAGLKLLEDWNQQGRLERCNLTVLMGSDQERFKFISEKTSSSVSAAAATNDPKEKQPSSALAHGQPSLDPFFVELKKEDEHQPFESEVQFQAIKQLLRQRAAQDPERYRAMAPQIAVMSAEHFLNANFPGCTISDKGEFPVIIDGVSMTIRDTRLMVAKDPTKDTNNVIAAIHLVPLPGKDNMSWIEICDNTWIGSTEMDAAEQALLAVLKQWYKEGKLADDCMAQITMGTDATIYKFVDGDRFEDYPEERQKQFKWG